MRKFILFFKVGLVLLSAAWAVHVWRFYLFLASVFPTSKPVESNATEFLASLQGYAIMLGPLIIALLLLIIHFRQIRF